jgi:hypothetical protein
MYAGSLITLGFKEKSFMARYNDDNTGVHTQCQDKEESNQIMGVITPRQVPGKRRVMGEQ